MLPWLTLALCIAAIATMWPLWPALVLAAWTAHLGTPLLKKLSRRLHGRHRAAGLLATLLALLVFIPLALAGAGIAFGARDLVSAVSESDTARTALKTLTSGGTGGEVATIPNDINQAIALAQKMGTRGVGVLTGIAGLATQALIGIIIFFAGAYALLLEGSVAWAWVKRRVPLAAEHCDRLAAAFHETGRGLLVGVGLTCAVQGLAATLLYLALGVPRFWILGPITGVCAIIPFVGTAMVWGPLAAGLFLDGSTTKGVILCVIGVAVISTLDNVLRPLFSRYGQLRMPMFLTFVAVFGGLAILGAWGALLGPLVVRLAMEALSIYGERPSRLLAADGAALHADEDDDGAGRPAPERAAAVTLT